MAGSEPVVTISKVAFGGSGIGHLDGKVCFVPFTVPGDTVRIRTIQSKKSHIFAEVVQLLEPSNDRVKPECPIFGACGGCDWQQMSYHRQLSAKRSILQENLGRAIKLAPEMVSKTIASPLQFGYRSRVQFKVRFVSGRIHLGFYRAGTHFVVDLPGRCALVHPAINAMIPALKDLILSLPEPDKVPQVDCEVGEDSSVLLIFHYIGANRQAIQSALTSSGHKLEASGLFIQYGRKSEMAIIAGADHISYTIPAPMVEAPHSITLSSHRGGFSQINRAQNLAMIGIIAGWCTDCPDSNLLDLYCGNGNLSLPIAHKFFEVLGLEAYEESIRDARENATRNNIGNAEYLVTDAVTGARTLRNNGKRFDTVILDPPRAGAADLVPDIPYIASQRLIYVSCDPATLARDLGYLQKDFEVMQVVPVDMFPQTYHIESITLLKKKGTK